MRLLFTLSILAVLIFSSCKKDGPNSPIDPQLTGQWEMISVKDYSTNEVFTEPTILTTEIDITISFTSSTNGNISGTLSTGTTVKGGFSVDQYLRIAVPRINLSYPPFDIFYGSFDWDSQFYSNITLSSNYSFDSSGNLNISCSNHKVLTFIKK